MNSINADSVSTIKHNVPSLKASLIGELDGEIALFRGIPYAIVERRWTQSKIFHQLKHQFDATKFGPRCPQPVTSSLVTGGVPDPIPGDDEFACLNLNIALPQRFLANDAVGKKLPVWVWIHGGSFISGSNSIARYRPQRLCELADRQGSPIVIVSLNYRLGAFGFVTSHDLIKEAAQTEQPAGNFGFLDQRNALEWVQTHIADFGGDPRNVTAIGVSAGGVCIHHHILTGKPLFDRAILMSGTAGTLGPLPFELFETQWQTMTRARELENANSVTRLEQLRQLSPDDLISSFGAKALSVWADENLFANEWNLGGDHADSRCKSILLGDVRMEGIILDRMSQRLPQDKFFDIIQKFFPDRADREELCSIFGWSLESTMSEITYRDGLRMFFSVAIFQYPTLKLAETFPGPTYLYHFEQPSPFPGPTQGHAYHGQCATYVHLNQIGTDGFDQGSVDICNSMAENWLKFVNDKAPWESYGHSQGHNKYMRLGIGGKSDMVDAGTDAVRPQQYLLWVERHWPSVQELCRFLLYKI